MEECVHMKRLPSFPAEGNRNTTLRTEVVKSAIKLGFLYTANDQITCLMGTQLFIRNQMRNLWMDRNG